MHHHKKHLYTLATSFIFTALLLGGNYALAAKDEMVPYFSKSGLFQTKTPESNTSERKTLRITNDSVINTEKVSSEIDQRPFINNVKNYIIRLDQTLGPALTPEEKNQLIDFELDKYVEYYRSKNALLKSKEKKYYNRIPGGEIYMTYRSENLGLQALRARILYSDTSKVQQILLSSDQGAFSLRAQDFFNSMALKKGITRLDGNIIDDWIEVTSPLKIFSALFPPKTAPYVLEDPKIENTDQQTESISVKIIDPVRNSKILYKISGHHTKQVINYKAAKYIIVTDHIKNYIKSPKNISFKTLKSPEGHPVLETTFFIKTNEVGRTKTAIRIRAVFADTYIMVQEMIAPKILMQSSFTQNLMAHTLFHPKMAFDYKAAKEKEEREYTQVPEEEMEFVKDPAISDNSKDEPVVITDESASEAP